MIERSVLGIGATNAQEGRAFGNTHRLANLHIGALFFQKAQKMIKADTSIKVYGLIAAEMEQKSRCEMACLPGCGSGTTI